MILSPSYDSKGLVNLIAEIETLLTGSATSPCLQRRLGSLIPEGDTIVLVLFDGLGSAQIGHPRAGPFRDSFVGSLEAGFPTTTSVSLSTVSTGLPPSQHGITSHLMWLPERERIVNTLKWVDLTGQSVEHSYEELLPSPNLWERIKAAGLEPITVQPGNFETTPLTRMLYRGARFEGVWDTAELVDATVQLAATPGRLVFTYVPQVDFAGHVHGTESREFAEAIELAGRIWEDLSRRLPPGVTLLGTADHGLIDYNDDEKLLVRSPEFDGVRFGGDSRGIQMWTSDETALALRNSTGGTLVDSTSLLGPDITAASRSRTGSHLLLAPDGRIVLPRGYDKRLHAYHGGLAKAEREIPLLIA